MTKPIDMILHCPRCGKQHIDAPEDGHHEGQDAQSGAWSPGWSNPPHRSHLCDCGCVWRPADVETNGVQCIKTAGKEDNWPTSTLEYNRAAPAA